MKKTISLWLAVWLLFSLAACAGKPAPENSTAAQGAQTAAGAAPTAAAAEDDAPAAAPTETEGETPAPGGDRVLVVVFSATGTTRGVAQKIAAIENADLYEIKAAQEYTGDDLNWHDGNSRTTREQNDKNARPEIGGESLSPAGYAKIYIGYPIWWGEEPRILDTFVESCDFAGVTVIPFCTSGGSGIGRSGQNLADLAGSGRWLEGKRFGGSVTEAELRAWIESLR